MNHYWILDNLLLSLCLCFIRFILLMLGFIVQYFNVLIGLI